jgi:hypothetical protein
MYKYFFSILLVFCVSFPGYVYSQERTDSSAGAEDSVVVYADSSALDSSGTTNETTQIYPKPDSLNMPVKDSAYLSAVGFREVPLRDVHKYLADRDYEYANDPEYWTKDKIQNAKPSSLWNFLRNKIFQWILLLGVIAVIIYGIFLLAKENNFRWFSRRSEQVQEDESLVLLQDPMDFDKAIARYQAESNYRFAIRYLFLRLIRLASEKNIIQLRDSMTNTEIGRSFGRHPLASQFRYLATAYEYVYFGEFNLNKETFNSLKEKFDVFQEKISS